MEVGFSFPESLTFPKNISASPLNRLLYLCLKLRHSTVGNWIFILQAVGFHNASVLLHNLIYLFDPYFDGDARGTIAVANLEDFPQTQTWYLLRYITGHKANQIFNVGSNSLCCDRQWVWTKNDYWIYHAVNCFELYRKKIYPDRLNLPKKKYVPVKLYWEFENQKLSAKEILQQTFIFFQLAAKQMKCTLIR